MTTTGLLLCIPTGWGSERMAQPIPMIPPALRYLEGADASAVRHLGWPGHILEGASPLLLAANWNLLVTGDIHHGNLGFHPVCRVDFHPGNPNCPSYVDKNLIHERFPSLRMTGSTWIEVSLEIIFHWSCRNWLQTQFTWQYGRLTNRSQSLVANHPTVDCEPSWTINISHSHGIEDTADNS